VHEDNGHDAKPALPSPAVPARILFRTRGKPRNSGLRPEPVSAQFLKR
jgi:hypothetical protein